MSWRGQIRPWCGPVVGLAATIFYVEFRNEPPVSSAPQAIPRANARAERSPSHRRLDALEQRVAALSAANRRLQLAAVARSTEQHLVQPTRNPEANESGETEMPISREEQREVRRQERQQFLTQLNETLENEVPDPEWRVRRERAIDTVFAETLGEHTSIEEASCASTTCRVRLSHPATDRLPTGELQLLSLNREGLADMKVYFQYGEGETTLFFVQPGIN